MSEVASSSDGANKKAKKEFNSFIHEAKEAETRGDFASALTHYKSALCLFPDHSKLLAKVDKLMEKVKYVNSLTAIDATWKQDPKTLDVLLDAGLSNEFIMTKAIFEKLYPHQREGVSWMWSLFKKSTGGILGDDMGLGKTIQVASFLHGLFHSQLIDTALLILPLSLMSNWETELARWCPKKRVRLFHGSPTNREKALDEISLKSGIILTTYETAQSAFKSLSMRGDEVFKWDVIILDEGHRIKDPTKKTSKAISTFQARSKFVLSGTPILNNLQELWALLNYTCDGQLLGEMKTFKREFEEPIVKGQLKGATEYEVKKGAAVTQKLRDLIAPHFIRRMKSDLLSTSASSTAATTTAQETSSTASSKHNLSSRDISLSSPENSSNASTPQKLGSSQSPSTGSGKKETSKSSSHSSDPFGDDLGDELAISLGAVSIRSPAKKPTLATAVPGLTVKKNDFVCWIPIEPLQLAIYTQFLVSQRDRISEAIATTGQALPAIRVLRQITNHPRLIRSQTAEDTLAFPGFNLPALATSQRCVEQSGKLRFLVDLLRKLKSEDHRVLIFSQSVKMLDLIEKCLEEEKTGWQRLRMDGSVNKVAERKALVDEYNTNRKIFLFLMTTQVGGVGITLTSADRVVIFDPAWNTAMDDQAADRVYRIGQKRNVVIYRLISSGTIEEKMYRKQVFKGALSKSLLGKEASVHTYFTRGELRELFTFDPADVREAQTQGLLTALHSHKRDSYPELEQELEFLNKLPTLVGVSDHNLLYTEETQRLQKESESETLAAQAHELLVKTIVPKDVIESEQAESSRRMASKAKRGPITTIYVDEDGNSLRPRKDPSQVGTRVGDITLLTVDDQFELGLANMKVEQSKVRKNPFSVREKPRVGNVGGNDHVQRLPSVMTKKPSFNQTSTSTTSTKREEKPKSPASTPLPQVSRKSDNPPIVKTSPGLPMVKKANEPVTIKKSGAVAVQTPLPSSSQTKQVTSGKLSTESADEEIARLLNEVSIEHDAKVSAAKSAVSAASVTSAPSASNATTTGITSAKVTAPPSVMKPKSRRIIEEDDDDEIPIPSSVVVPSVTASVSTLSQELDSVKVVPVEAKVEAKGEAKISKDAEPVSKPSTEKVVINLDDSDEESEEEVQRTIVVPKMSRKSIISFDVSPTENVAEQIAIDANTYEEDDPMFVSGAEGDDATEDTLDASEKASHEEDEESDENDDEEDEDEENSDEECSEASESEFALAAAERDFGRSSGLKKHFVEENVLDADEEEEEKTAKWIENDDDDFSSDGEDDADSHPSFIASDDEEDVFGGASDAAKSRAEEDEVVDFEEHDDVVRRLLQKKANVELISEVKLPRDDAKQDKNGEKEAITQTAQPKSSAKPAAAAPAPALSYTVARTKRRIIESDDEE